MKNLFSNITLIAMPVIVCVAISFILPTWITQGIIMFLCLVIITININQHETE